MFKYRVLTFTIILSMLLFYATPINCIYVKAEEVTYTQRQLQDVGAWFIGERLLEGAVENFNFDNLPTDITVDDFLADLGAIIAEGNPDPLINDLGQAADDIWNGIEQELGSWSADDAWSLVKDFFYTMWYDVPSTPSLPPLANVFGIAADVLKASGVDKLLQYANTDIPETYLPQDYLWFQNINNLYLIDIEFLNGQFYTRFGDDPLTPNNPINQYSYYIVSAFDSNNNSTNPHIANNAFSFTIDGCLPKIIFNYNTTTNSLSYNAFTSNSHVFSTYENMRMYKSGNKIIVQNQGSYSFNIQASFDGINSCLNWIYQHFYNIDFYVDGVLWVQGAITPSYPIASTDLTYPNYEPAKYTYPEGTSVDWNRLYTIIYNAVRDGIVLDFGDLEDCFVDVNGQTAIATLGLVRNDYDNLVQEQFTMIPYPRFNDNLWLSNLAEEMTGPAQNGVAIIENAYNIFPLPLQKALLFAGALLLFGLLIRRFLE